MPVTRTSLPGGAVVAIVKRCRAKPHRLDAPRSWAARSTAGRHVDVSTVGSANTSKQRERRVNGHEQRHGDGEPQNPAARREHRHVHVVQHEHLIAQHRQPVEVVRSLVVRDRRDRGLQPRHVGLERDRDPVAEASLDAVLTCAGTRSRWPTRRVPNAARDAPASRLAAITPWPRSMSHSASSASGSAAATTSGTPPASFRARAGSRACRAATSTTTRAADRHLCMRPPLRRGRHRSSPLHPRARKTAGPAGRTSCGTDRRSAISSSWCQARRPGRARARRCDPPDGPWKSDARSESSCSDAWRRAAG